MVFLLHLVNDLNDLYGYELMANKLTIDFKKLTDVLLTVKQLENSTGDDPSMRD